MKSFITLLATASFVSAQVYIPPPQPGQGAGPARSETIIRNGPQEQPKQSSPFGSELPFMDPSSETISWNGHNWAGTDNRIVAARFERFLNEPEENSGAALEYRNTIAEILAQISPHHPGGPNFAGGVRLLPKASSFPADAKLCDSLSQAIYTAVLAKKDVGATRAMNAAMEEERQRLIRNGDMIGKTSLNNRRAVGGTSVPQNGNGNNRQQDGNGNTTTNDSTGGSGTSGNVAPGSSMQLTEIQRRVVEIDGMKKENTAKVDVQILQAKIQYQALMMQFFMQRRFEHVVMASRFYNQIFRDGDGKLYVDKKSDMAKLFSESLGTSPTVAALDSLASEAIRDVDQGVEAFKFLVEKKEYQSAAKRLSEAYVVGEFMPSIRTLSRDSKRQVLKFVQESYKLIGALDAKDYTRAKELVTSLKAMSDDFDSGKPEAAIASYTRASDMSINAAKISASAGDVEKARKEIQEAMEIWPQNPKLAEFDRLVESSGTMVVAKNDFDRLLSEQNYREIMRRQYEIAPSIKGDAAREDAFRQVISNLVRIDTALGKAGEFSRAGQEFAAWEQLAALRSEFPDDPKLGREMELLAPRVASFTMALDKAAQLEQRREIGSSMSWYLKARSIYPRSDRAQQGIDRLVKVILPDRN